MAQSHKTVLALHASLNSPDLRFPTLLSDFTTNSGIPTTPLHRQLQVQYLLERLTELRKMLRLTITSLL